VKDNLNQALQEAGARRQRREDGRQLQEAIDDSIRNRDDLIAGPRPQGAVLQPDELERVTTLRRMKKAETLEDVCAVCQEACIEGDEVRKLPCGHEFHSDCIDKWLLTRKDACPMCSMPVTQKKKE